MVKVKKRRSLFFKQTLAYLGTFLIALVIMSASVYYFCSNYYFDQKSIELTDQARSIAKQYSKYVSSGVIDMNSLKNKMEVIEDFMGTSIFVIDIKGSVSVVSSSINSEWIGQSITDETINSVLNGKIVTVQGRLGGMFSENMMTVGYPIKSNGNVYGGIFVCSPVPEIQETLMNVIEIMIFSVVVGFGIAIAMIYILSRRITRPLLQMNKAARIIADGNFDRRIDVTTNDEIGELGESFNYMAECLDKRDQDRRLFVASIAHDLRSPLTSIQGFLHAMKDGIIQPEDYNYYIDIILEETERLSVLATNIVDMGKTQENVLELKIETFDINELIRDVLDVFEHRFREKNLKCRLIIADERIYVSADKREIHRVLHNLVDNAVKFTDENGIIEVETSLPKNENKVYVSVSDSGKGVPDSEKRHIFEAFYKSDSSRGLDKTGSGIGLSVVKEIINAHGEIVVCKDSESGGAKFEFSLKPAEEQEEKNEVY